MSEIRTRLLSVLQEHPSGLTSREVGSLLQMDHKTAGANLSKMFAYGDIKRQQTKRPNGEMIYLAPEYFDHAIR